MISKKGGHVLCVETTQLRKSATGFARRKLQVKLALDKLASAAQSKAEAIAMISKGPHRCCSLIPEAKKTLHRLDPDDELPSS